MQDTQRPVSRYPVPALFGLSHCMANFMSTGPNDELHLLGRRPKPR